MVLIADAHLKHLTAQPKTIWFQGTAALLKTIVETKKATILPLVETAIETKKALIESDAIKGIIKAKSGVVATLAETGPQIGQTIGGVIGTVVDVAPAIIKAGVCGLVCPIAGEQCKQDHCGGDSANNDVVVEPRSSKTIDDYGDYGDFGSN